MSLHFVSEVMIPVVGEGGKSSIADCFSYFDASLGTGERFVVEFSECSLRMWCHSVCNCRYSWWLTLGLACRYCGRRNAFVRKNISLSVL